MTKDEALKLALEALESCDGYSDQYFDVVKVDSALAAIKEALAQPEQEPVYLAWFYEEEGWFETTKDHYDITDEEDRWLLYPAPPKREWVCLTDEQIQFYADQEMDVYSFARAIEAAHGIKE